MTMKAKLFFEAILLTICNLDFFCAVELKLYLAEKMVPGLSK